MTLNFIFSNLYAILLTLQFVFLVIVAIRFYRSASVKNISLSSLILIAIGLNIFYVMFVTWGQYYTWSISSDVSKILLELPLAKEAPLPAYAEWLRPTFDNPLGYFTYYVLGRVWLDVFLLFLTSTALYLLLSAWHRHRGGFEKEGAQLILLLMLVVGWPANIVFVYLGFGLALMSFLYFFIRGQRIVKIESAFIWAAFIALLCTPQILHVL